MKMSGVHLSASWGASQKSNPSGSVVKQNPLNQKDWWKEQSGCRSKLKAGEKKKQEGSADDLLLEKKKNDRISTILLRKQVLYAQKVFVSRRNWPVSERKKGPGGGKKEGEGGNFREKNNKEGERKKGKIKKSFHHGSRKFGTEGPFQGSEGRVVRKTVAETGQSRRRGVPSRGKKGRRRQEAFERKGNARSQKRPMATIEGRGWGDKRMVMVT